MDFLKDLSLDKVRNLAEDAFNQAKPKTEVEARVYEVLSHKNWGSSSSLMNEISRDTYDYDKFAVVSQLLWESLENQRPAAWRVVFKGLTLLEHLIKNGSERCVDDARNHGHLLRSLFQFNYYEGTVDRGVGVREKSKQLAELLADDERIREERTKARKLREKFGGNLGGVSSGGGASGSGGYAGYGNDSGWNSSSGDGGGSSGYGMGGIGTGGRYDEDRGARGRYGDDVHHDAPAPAPTPTFAAIPDDSTKKIKTKKTKKKKQVDDGGFEAQAPAASEPAVDLFSFDAPPAPAPAASQDDDFAAFQSAGSTATVGTPAVPNDDPFAAPLSAANSFDAFGQTGGSGMNAFGNTMGASNGFAPMAGSSVPMGGFPMGSGPMGGAAMNGKPNTAPPPADDDEFGDFANAAPTKAAPVAASSSSGDPLSRLISLDGLTKNKKKEEDNRLNQPIAVNAAAATYLQEKASIQANLQQHKKGNMASFEGLDGLPKHNPNMSMGMMHMSSNPSAMGMNPNVMGGGGAAKDVISMLDPSVMNPQKPQPPSQQQRMMMQQQQQMMGGMPGAMPGAMSGMPGGMGAMPGAMSGMPGGMGAMPGGMGGMGMQNAMPMGGMQGMGMSGGMGMQGSMSGMGGMGMQGGMMNPGMSSQNYGMGMMPQGMSGGMMGGQQQQNNSSMGGWQ